MTRAASSRAAAGRSHRLRTRGLLVGINMDAVTLRHRDRDTPVAPGRSQSCNPHVME